MKDRIYNCYFGNHYNNHHSYVRTTMRCYNLNFLQRLFLKLAGFEINRLFEEEEKEEYFRLKVKYDR